MRVNLFCFLIVVLLGACETSVKKSITTSKTLAKARKFLEGYSFPVLDSITNENLFIYYNEQRGDTSFVLVLSRDSSFVRGIYHEVSPYNREFAHLSDVEFFTGFRFSVDVSVWDSVIMKTEKVLSIVNHEPDTNCLDCGTSIVSYGGRFTYPRPDNSAFKLYEQFLRRLVVYPIYAKKRLVEDGAIMTE